MCDCTLVSLKYTMHKTREKGKRVGGDLIVEILGSIKLPLD
jgi:hypothetical protein